MSFQEVISRQAMTGVNHSGTDSFAAVVERRITRRDALRRLGVSMPLLALTPRLLADAASPATPAFGSNSPGSLGFRPIGLSQADEVVVPQGYTAQVVVSWGDPLTTAAPAFDLAAQSPAAAVGQFGFNNDYLGYFPLPAFAVASSNHGVLAVNHEYSDPRMMFPGYQSGQPTAEQVAIEIASHGMSFLELRRHRTRWQHDPAGPRNRRVTGETPCEITGPAAGHPWLRTAADPTGRHVLGTINNCAGGKTPWGTVLSCEENFNQYFAHAAAAGPDHPQTRIHARYGVSEGPTPRRWENFHDRFDIAKEPNEVFRFGWVVEIDPYDPTFVPRKRTALGRFKHEGATTMVTKDGRVAVYSGDDERFDYVYKFVSHGRYDPANRAANRDLLDHGTLYAARFNDDGTGEWLPLVQGRGPLTAANGFDSQAAVLINTRGAADARGATRMDRPEDIEANPANGKVYAVMTNNNLRGTGQGRDPGVDAANPRAENAWGHVIEFTEHGDDYAAEKFAWEIFIRCGDPHEAAHNTYFAGYDPSRCSPIGAPDNLAFDPAGHCWISTDGLQATLAGNDGVFVAPTAGNERGYLRQFLSGPVDSEICGPEFTPDGQTLFVAIQHPGEGGTLDAPTSRWPAGLARPSVIAITRDGGGAIGT